MTNCATPGLKRSAFEPLCLQSLVVPAGNVLKLKQIVELGYRFGKRKEKNLIRDPARSSTNSRKSTLLWGKSFWINITVGFPVWAGVLVFVWGENVSELGVRRMKEVGHAGMYSCEDHFHTQDTTCSPASGRLLIHHLVR